MDSNSVMGQQIQKDIEETARLRSLMNPPPPEEFNARKQEALAQLEVFANKAQELSEEQPAEVATAEKQPEGEEHAEG